MKKFNCFLSKLLIVGLVSSSISSFAPPVLANETVVTTEETTSLPDESTTSPEVSAPEEAITVPPAETPITPPIPETEQEPLKQDVATPTITDAPTIADPQPEAAPEKKTIPLQLLGINDFHGALSTTGTAYIEGTAFSKAGKAALLATYLNNAQTNFQSEKPDGTTIRVQAGDMVGASPANSGLLQDEPTIKVLNKMNFEIGTLGNHEFDEGLGEFNRIMTGQAPLPGEFNQITEDYTHEASTQDIVIANMTDKNGNIPYGWEPYTIKTVKDGDKEVKVGFIGIVTTEIPNLVLKQHYQDYNFLDEAETIAKYDKILQDQGVNAIVVLAHVPAVSTNQVVSGEAADIMDKVNTASPDNSVDAFFAGHNHQYTNGVVGKTRIVQSTSQGKAFINLKAELDPETNDFVAVPDAEVTPVQAGVTEDPEVKAIIDDADTRVTKVTSEKIGTATTNQTISREVEKDSPNKESAVGNLVTDGQRVMAQKQGFNVDFAMTNNGGIRADLLVQEDHSITWGAAQNVQPFGNILQVVHMTGQQIENVLNEQYDEEGKYFLQLSGLTYQYTDTGDANQPYKVHQIRKTNGELLDPNASYLVVVNDFLFGGGDGFKTFTEATFEATMTQDTDTFIDYIKAQEADGKTIEAQIEGRKSYISPEQIKAEEEAAAIASIKAATVLPDIKEGITTFTGKTIPNGTVTAQLKDSKARTILSTTANEKGDFTLDLQSLNLAKDHVVTFVVTDANGYSAAFDKTVLAKEENGESAAIEAIKAATVLPDIKEGVTTFTGKTIPNGTVTAQLKNSKARAILSTTANEKGDFALDLQSLNLAKDHVVTFVVKDANGYSVAFDKTVLAKEENGEAAAIAAIKAATVLPDIKEGITTFTGKTIPNGTVTAQLKNSKARAILSTTANANGDFTLDLQSLNLAKDLVVTFVVTDANGYSVAFDKTVLAKEENGEAAAIAAIKAATVLPDIKEGITTFIGKTIPNGTVTAQLKNSKARAILSTTANANGDFTLDLQSLNLAKDLVVTFVVTDANGYSVVFDKTVLAKDAVTNGNGTTTGNGNNGTPTGTTNNPLSPPTVAASFPQTGEKESSVSTLAGLILLGSAAFYLTKKNKHKSIA